MTRNVRRIKVEENHRKKRLVYLTFGIMMFIYLTMNMVLGDSGFLKYMELRETRDRLTEETMALKAQNEAMQSDIEQLRKNPDSVEGIAREYGLSKKDELIFRFKD